MDSLLLARALCLTRPSDVVDRVRALGCAARRSDPVVLVYRPTCSRWTASGRFSVPTVLSDLCGQQVIVNCQDLAALCHVLICALGGQAMGVFAEDQRHQQLRARAGLQPMGCAAPHDPPTWDCHYTLADVPSADGSRSWVDTTLGPSPWTALRAADARGYAEAAFEACSQPVLRWGVALYDRIETVTPDPLWPHEQVDLLSLATVGLSPPPATWPTSGQGRARRRSAGPVFADGLLRRGAAVFGPVADDAPLSSVDAQAENGAVRVELAIFCDANRASAALDQAPEALPQPRGAPKAWSPLPQKPELRGAPVPSPTLWRALQEGLKLRATEWGEVMLAGGCALLRIQPLLRDAELARDLAVERAVEAFARSR